MKPLPRVLFVDDVYGRAQAPRNRDRELFCARLGVSDVTGDVATNPVDEPVAEAILHSGQVRRDNRVENDLDGVIERVRAGWRQWPRWAMVLLDMHFQTGPIDPATGEAHGDPRDRDPEHYFGLQILDRLLAEKDLQGLPIVILSAMERERIEQRFARQGVFAFVEKEQLNRERLQELLLANGYLQDEKILGQSLPLLRALRDARRMSQIGNANMLVLGETGTGKELVAEYIHRASGRSGNFRKLFVRANDDMFSADLFGYVKGAFTGAIRDRAGEAEMADRGTLFFDEFGDIPLGTQDKLMRLLDTSTREAQRIGDTRSRQLDLQVVLATNKFEIVKSGFRRDLLQRANASNPIVLPPLRERPEDIGVLVEFFVRKHEKELGAEHREISSAALEILTAGAWPGNVRELEHEILQAVSSYRGIRVLSPEHLAMTHRTPLVTGVAGVDPTGLPDAAAPAGADPAPTAGADGADAANGAALTVEELIDRLGELEFSIAGKDSWLGRLGDVQGAYARLVARYLSAALEASALASGQPKPTTAVRMVLGKKTLRTSDAASAIKRLLSISRDAITDLLEDETLHLGTTLQWAENLRGSKSGKRTPGSHTAAG